MTTPSLTDSRAEFERYMSMDGKWAKAIERSTSGEYLLMRTATGWMDWQAAWEVQQRRIDAMVGKEATK